MLVEVMVITDCAEKHLTVC